MGPEWIEASVQTVVSKAGELHNDLLGFRVMNCGIGQVVLVIILSSFANIFRSRVRDAPVWVRSVGEHCQVVDDRWNQHRLDVGSDACYQRRCDRLETSVQGGRV